jgi:ankyrin repeat protein
MKRLVLNILYGLEKTGNSILPLFLRDVGKYYWNRKTFILQYGLDMEKCVENELGRTFRFLNTLDLFIEAAKQGNIKILKYCLNRGVDINHRSGDALRWASLQGHLEAVKYLIQNGSDEHVKSNWPLLLASQRGHLEVVKYLLNIGHDIQALKHCALYNASTCGRLELVKFLVENGANVHDPDGYGRNDSALYTAFGNGYFKVVKYLLENGADPNRIDL